MKKMKKALTSIILAACLITGTYSSIVYADEVISMEEQDNAISMLNYITVLTQEINASKNSRLYMEKAYSTLINNTYPNAVDNRTLSQMTGLLDTMERYRMIDVKRERLQYIYEQSQAQAIRAKIPNPLGLIGAVSTFNPIKLVSAVVYMAVDSHTSYTAYMANAEQQFLKDGWALDDEEAGVLHESRKGTFSYMVKMVNDYNIPGDQTLTEDTVDEFVEWKNSTNVAGKIQFLESNKKTYQAYGGYWLTLADSYYNNQDYQKCIDAITTYEDKGTRIFRRDYELAKVLPLAIAAASETYDIEEYAPYAAEKAQLIVDNTDHDDWALRYFAAQTLVDLYAETKDNTYLENAYNITVDSVNYLISEQQELNSAYLMKPQEKTIPKDADKDEKKEIKEYNKMLKEVRKTEMAPIYEPLLLNCELLFAIADERDTSASEKTKIDNILHPNGGRLFLVETIDDQFWFDPVSDKLSSEDMDIVYGGNGMIIPVSYLSKDASIKASVIDANGEETDVFTDWTIEKVERETEDDVSTYEAAFSSNEAKKHKWVPNETVLVEISPMDGMDNTFYQFKYQTKGTKNAWYDYLKVWEGHKNNWYDYVKAWENSVKFERVE